MVHSCSQFNFYNSSIFSSKTGSKIYTAGRSVPWVVLSVPWLWASSLLWTVLENNLHSRSCPGRRRRRFNSTGSWTSQGFLAPRQTIYCWHIAVSVTQGRWRLPLLSCVQGTECANWKGTQQWYSSATLRCRAVAIEPVTYNLFVSLKLLLEFGFCLPVPTCNIETEFWVKEKESFYRFAKQRGP